jgi:quercetin dioxygenase-like cupin family protein
MTRREREESIISRRNALLAGATAGAAALALSGAERARAQVVPNVPLGSFDATGLPAGPATGVARRSIVAPGTNIKHVHGGNLYAFVAAGTFTVEIRGERKTYQTGEFFWERAGEEHTAISEEGAELYILQFLTPGAAATLVTQ